MKPYFETELGTLYHGDCLKIMPLLKEKVDMVLTDPPYGTTVCKWDSIIPLDLMWKEIKRLIKDNGAIALFGNQPFVSKLIISNIEMFKYELIWERNTPTGFYNAKIQQLKTHENILIFYKKQSLYNPQMIKRNAEEYKKSVRIRNCECPNPEIYGGGRKKIIRKTAEEQKYRFPFTIIKIKKERIYNNKKHPTHKPVALMEYLINTYTNNNDMVLDFSIGSGTTAIACERLNRQWIGIEINKEYCDIAVDRIKKETAQYKLAL